MAAEIVLALLGLGFAAFGVSMTIRYQAWADFHERRYGRPVGKIDYRWSGIFMALVGAGVVVVGIVAAVRAS